MLDALKRVNELRDVIASARAEREGLSSMLEQIGHHRTDLAEAAASVGQTREQAAAVQSSLRSLEQRVSALDAHAAAEAALDSRLRAIEAALTRAEQTAGEITGPEGAVQQQRVLTQQLASQELQARATLEALRGDSRVLDETREQVRQAVSELRAASEKMAASKADIDQVRTLATQLSTDYSRLRDTARDAREQTGATVEAVKDMEKKFASFGALEEMSKTARERLSALNLLAEHVAQKTKALESQRDVIEHAIVEANRLNELVWNMDQHVTKLTEGFRNVSNTEETLGRLEKLARDADERLEAGGRARAALQQDLARLDANRSELAALVGTIEERLALGRQELASVGERAGHVQETLGRLEQSADALQQRDGTISGLAQQLAALETQAGRLVEQAETLQRKQTELEGLRERLDELDEVGSKTALTFEHLTGLRQDLVVLKDDLAGLQQLYREASQLRDKLDADRASLGKFLDRLDAFRILVPELDAKMNAITSKLSVVDDGAHKAANLVNLADGLDRQMVRIAGNHKFVEKVEARINALQALVAEVERRAEEQISRRAEIDGLKNACDTVGVQVTDLHQKLEGVSATQASLLPLGGQIAILQNHVEKLHTRLAQVQKDEAAIVEQERTLSELLVASRTVADEVKGRLLQVEGLGAELARSAALKDELLEELVRVQTRQRDVAAQAAASEDQLKRLETVFKQIEQRRTQLTFIERSLSAFDGRLGDLKTMAEGVERTIDQVSAKAAVVDAVKREVDSVQDLAARSRADLEHLSASRADVAALKARMAELLALGERTRAQIDNVEARRTQVDEVYVKTNLAMNVLEDVRLNLELVNEQRAIVDHVAEDLARLGKLSQDAQRTLQALRAERELAERIERSIKTLRGKTEANGDESAKRSA